MQQILKQVKDNKKYKTIADTVVKNEIKKYLKSHLSSRKNKEITKQDIKKIRAKLHKIYSSFQTKKKKKRYQYLNNLKQLLKIRSPSSKDLNDIKEINNKLLSITLSTKERINNYLKLYQQIFEITGKPESLIDLGSGLNPLSYPYMNLNKKPLVYLAYDIDEEDIKFLNEYFKIMKKQGLNGKAAILDITDLNKIKKLPFSDIVFMFKIIDIIDIKNHKLSEELIKQLIPKTKFIIASFATKTTTRKKMNYPNRKWFELMLKRNNLDFKIINISNEVFYIIEKSR